MAKCGNCKQVGMTIEHVRECYASRGTTSVAVIDAPAAPVDLDVPASCYALDRDGTLTFFEVRIGKQGTKWDGFRFVDRLVGAPGDWMRYPVKGETRKDALGKIALDTLAAAVRYSHEFVVCAACGAPLSDEDSRTRGLGPVCAKKF